MSTPHTATASLAVLVDELVTYLRDQHEPQDESERNAPPAGLARVFDTFSHHLVALTLVARSDDKAVAKEREVTFRHCKSRARTAGLEMSRDEDEALNDYLRDLKPTIQQVSLMLDRLKHDTKAEILGLVAAAHAVVEADGVVRLQEVCYLASLQHALLAF